MKKQEMTVFVEIPSDIPQEEVWRVEKQLKDIEFVKTNLQEPKDIVAITMLILHISTSIAGAVTAVAGGTKATYEVAKILFDFLHPTDKKQLSRKAKKKIVILKNGKRIELFELSIEEIKHILEALED